MPITKVEFLNGTNKNALVLRRLDGINLTKNELSGEFKISGFTEEYGTDERYCAVMLTYGDGTELFNHWHSGHESKILVTLRDNWRGKEIEFSKGKW
jgi:hypothetical protein